MEDVNGNGHTEEFISDEDGLVYGSTVESGTAIYTEGDYSVYVGRIITSAEKGPDMDHYLIVNDAFGVIEGSSNRLVDARAGAWALAGAKQEQDARIESGTALVVEDVSKNANRNKSWPQH